MDALTKATAFGLDRIYKAFEKPVSSAIPAEPQQPMCRYPDLVEGSSPCADTGTAGVSDLYPVRCAARYYDAASQILEDEPKLFSHHNANELGALIEAWIYRARNNWEPK
jgi:hypothetical protein